MALTLTPAAEVSAATDAELDRFTQEVTDLVHRHMRGETDQSLYDAIAELREASRERHRQALENIGSS